MEVYRLAAVDYADLSGLGGVYSSARWHKAGKPIIYTASSRSLAVLERFIHEHDIENIALVMMTIHIPPDALVARYSHRQLPTNWDTINKANHQNTQDIGSTFLKEKSHSVLQVPSAIVPHEYNYLLNPLHSDAQTFRLIDSHPYRYDKRYQKFTKSHE